jgi:hypothetical protein
VAGSCGREEIRKGEGMEWEGREREREREVGGGVVKKDSLCEGQEDLVISLAYDKIRAPKLFHVHLFAKQSGYKREI